MEQITNLRTKHKQLKQNSIEITFVAKHSKVIFETSKLEHESHG